MFLFLIFSKPGVSEKTLVENRLFKKAPNQDALEKKLAREMSLYDNCKKDCEEERKYRLQNADRIMRRQLPISRAIIEEAKLSDRCYRRFQRMQAERSRAYLHLK